MQGVTCQIHLRCAAPTFAIIQVHQRALLRDRDMQWSLQKVGLVEAARFDGFENVSPSHSDKLKRLGAHSAHRRAKRSGALGAKRRVVRMGCREKWSAEGKLIRSNCLNGGLCRGCLSLIAD